MNWLVLSIALSIVLTVVVNVVLRAFPRSGDRLGQKLDQLAAERPGGGVSVPWRAMIVASIVLTIGLNLALWASR